MATVGQPGAMRRITVHYAGDEGTFEFGIGDVLHDQEILYQSIMGARTTATSENSHYYQGEGSSGTGTAGASRASDDQIAADFEYAKQLQEMEDLTIDTPPNNDDDEQDDISCVASPSDTDDDDGDNVEEAAREEEEDDDHDHDRRDHDDDTDDDDHHDRRDHDDDTDDDDDDHDRRDHDDDDTDNMTYEQGEVLVESVGNEGRGLSDELISYLVPSTYKSGFFARKSNHDDCIICLSAFKNRESIITLPCKHYYHAACIAKWLKINKTCPICKYEVFGPS